MSETREALGPLRVLMVEDSEADAQLVLHALKQIDPGARADVAATRGRFAELLLEHEYDVVLADFRMPNWTGMEALRELRDLGFDIPVIIVTGTLGDENAVECVRAGAADYVLKGNLARLPIAIRRAMDEQRSRQEAQRAQRLMAEAQRELREREEQFQKLAHASFDAIVITQDGVLREVNRGFLEIFGFDRMEEVLGRPVTDLVAEESRAEVERRYAGNVEGTYELLGRRRDGKRLLLEATAGSHTIGGAPARITALRDMTERRALEEQVRQVQKMEAVGRLAGGVAHDFNNLLTVITINTELLLDDCERDDPRRADLQEVRKAAETAAGLTRQLLAFSRQQVIEPRVVVLDDVVRRTQQLLTRLIGEDIDLGTHFGTAPCVIHIDPGQLEQVIVNLVVNARDAMPTGGKLSIETSVVDIDEGFAAAHPPATRGRYAMLSVSDTGIGMDAETRARIFEPFFTTKGQGEGTGLGLATVYAIVEQSGGYIWVDSEPGKGATFRTYLPLYESAELPVSEDHVRQPAVRGTETVLLVEDAQAVRDVARRALEEHGYDVVDAPSASAALELAANLGRPVHLLLTDVVMPEMSGRVLAERIATLQPTAKVLYMSGYTDDAVIRHGVLRATTPFLQKPFTALALAARVREVLDR
jgi:PAS domain S-box-containing protein